jgi:PilZ domain-containing protein
VPAKFQINDQVRITLVHQHAPSAELPTFQCTGLVTRFSGETLVISVPTSGPMPLYTGQAVLIRRILHESWKHEGVITRCTESGNSVTVAMQLLRSEKVERREFVRIRLEAKVRYACVTEPEKSAKREWRQALLRDISGGGARLTATEALMLNENVVLELPVDGRVLHLKARVQRSQPEPGSPGKTDIGLEFIDIRQSECNLVMSLVFRLQLKFQRRKAVSTR